MHDPLTFEARLSAAFERFAAEAPVEIDATAMSHLVAASAVARRGFLGRWLGGLLPTDRAGLGWRTVLVAFALLVALIVGALAVGALRPARVNPLLGRNGPIAYSLADGAGSTLFHAHLMDADGSHDRAIGQAMCPIFSQDGTVLAYKSGLLGGTELNVAAPNGSSPRIVSGIGDSDLALSPDGTRIAWLKALRPITSPDSNTTVGLKDELWVTPVSGGPGMRIVPAADAPNQWYGSLEWSPDGRQIAFASNISAFTGNDGQSHRAAIYVVRDDGSNLHAVTTRPGTDQIGFSWSPDSRYIAYDGLADGPAAPSATTSGPPLDVFVIKADGTEERNLTQATADDFQPDWSPDGLHLAYETSVDGAARLATFRMDGPAAVGSPTLGPPSDLQTWSPDGTHLLAVHVVVLNSSDSQQVQTTVESVDAEFREPPTTLLVAPFGIPCAPSWQRLAP